MTVISQLLVLVGVLSLFHAYVPSSQQLNSRLTRRSGYSAHEFTTLSNRVHTGASLPIDIQVETIVAVFLSCFGFVLGSQPFKPVSWSTWAGKIEREGRPNPFQYLENRVGFMDIRVGAVS